MTERGCRHLGHLTTYDAYVERTGTDLLPELKGRGYSVCGECWEPFHWSEMVAAGLWPCLTADVQAEPPPGQGVLL